MMAQPRREGQEEGASLILAERPGVEEAPLPPAAAEETSNVGDGSHETHEDGEQQDELSEEDDDDDVDNDRPDVLGPFDPRRMDLTGEELDWAFTICDAMGMVPELDPISDFMVAQIALIVGEDVEQGIQKAFGLQAFRQEYGITDSLQEGVQALRTMVQLLPRNLLSFGYSHRDGCYVLVHDIKAFDMCVLNTPKKLGQWLVGAYYLHHAMNMDMESIRKGMICCVECEGYDWNKKVDFNVLSKLFTQLLSSYPYKGVGKHYHTGTVFNVIASMLRKLLPEPLKSRFHVGCPFEGGRLDQVYLVPTVEMANARLLSRLEEALRRRYDNQASFKLHHHDDNNNSADDSNHDKIDPRLSLC